MVNIPNGVETLPKISITLVRRTNVTDRQTDGRWHIRSRSLKIDQHLSLELWTNVQWHSSYDSLVQIDEFTSVGFLPRCMECQRGLAIRERCLSVRPSVDLSVKRVNCDKTEERSVQIFIPYKRSFSLVLWEEEWLVGGCLKFWVKLTPLERNRRFSVDIRSQRFSGST